MDNLEKQFKEIPFSQKEIDEKKAKINECREYPIAENMELFNSKLREYQKVIDDVIKKPGETAKLLHRMKGYIKEIRDNGYARKSSFEDVMANLLQVMCGFIKRIAAGKDTEINKKIITDYFELINKYFDLLEKYPIFAKKELQETGFMPMEKVELSKDQYIEICKRTLENATTGLQRSKYSSEN